MLRNLIFTFSVLIGSFYQAFSQNNAVPVLPGAYQMGEYLPLLRNKKVGLVVNHTSVVERVHLIDTLSSLGIEIARVFSPEHGLRGKVSAGKKIEYNDTSTPYEIISLYGKNKKPTAEHLQGLDIIVFDIQDVGVRFYTYISTMYYMMEACAENQVPLLVLDRPNPNGSYTDGPVLDTNFRSFVGIVPIPIVYGMTMGELANMINGENWLGNGLTTDLVVIRISHWTHNTHYPLSIKPSPNLPNDLSIALYPSLCLFEGTIMSVGRGTDQPFQQIGHPQHPDTSHHFIPKSMVGARYPPYKNKRCFGKSWENSEKEYKFTLEPLLDSYNKMKNFDFFNNYFVKLAGTATLQKQIEMGMDETEIRLSWKKELEDFMKRRKPYLLY